MRPMPTPAALPVRLLLLPVELADGVAELGADAQDEALMTLSLTASGRRPTLFG